MTQSTTISSALIEGNSFGTGTDAVSGTPTTYIYQQNLRVEADAKIVNNTFAGIGTIVGSPFMLVIGECNCIVTNNYFIRGSAALDSYILNVAGYDQFITGNFFDSSFSSGTNETLALGITTKSVFEKNKNQIAYTSLLLGEMFALSPSPLTYLFGFGVTSVGLVEAPFASNPSILGVMGDITKYLPDGVQLLYAMLGVSLNTVTSTIDTSLTNTTQYTIYTDNVANFSTLSPPASFAGSLADNVANSNSTANVTVNSNVLTINAGNVATFHTTTQYMYTDLTAQNFVTGKNFSINIQLTGEFNAASGQSVVMGYSPLLLKYVW